MSELNGSKVPVFQLVLTTDRTTNIIFLGIVVKDIYGDVYNAKFADLERIVSRCSQIVKNIVHR